MAEHPKPLAALQTFPLSNSAVNFISMSKLTISSCGLERATPYDQGGECPGRARKHLHPVKAPLFQQRLAL
jgi:hypothetical protein